MPRAGSFVVEALFVAAVLALGAGLVIGPPAAPAPGQEEESRWRERSVGRARLLPLPATACAGLPAAVAWSAPMGTEGGAFCYNAQAFGEDNPRRGGRHLGDDLNGIGQENTDRGDPVFAAADGLVAYAGFASPGWGGVVIVLHRLPGGGVAQTFYGHLEPGSLAVRAGARVGRGQELGHIGLPEAVDFAHLHLEVREGACVDPGPGYASEPARTDGRTSPAAFLAPRLAPAGLPPPPIPARPGPPVETLENKGLPGNHGNAGHTTVAAFLPWRGSRAVAPWPLAAVHSAMVRAPLQPDSTVRGRPPPTRIFCAFPKKLIVSPIRPALNVAMSGIRACLAAGSAHPSRSHSS